MIVLSRMIEMAFKKGVSGNPAGRPSAAYSRQALFNALVEPKKEKIIEKIIDLALGGNIPMLTLLADRLLPAKPKDEPISFDLDANLINSNENEITPSTAAKISVQVVKALAEGRLTPDEASNITNVISSAQQTPKW